MKLRKKAHPFLNLANTLSMIRVLAIPLILFYLENADVRSSLIAAGLFALICMTDWVDGYVARRYKLVSNFGKFLDPLADKLLIIITLIMLLSMNRVQPILVILVIFREISITGLRAMASAEKLIISAGKWGKLKTAFQMIGIIFLLIHYSTFGFDAHRIGVVLLWFSVGLSMISGYEYVARYVKKILSRHHRRK